MLRPIYKKPQRGKNHVAANEYAMHEQRSTRA
jgi:hypothetical protein